MAEELMKQICKSKFLGYSENEIAKLERLQINDIQTALDWGESSGYFEDLRFVQEMTDANDGE